MRAPDLGTRATWARRSRLSIPGRRPSDATGRRPPKLARSGARSLPDRPYITTLAVTLCSPGTFACLLYIDFRKLNKKELINYSFFDNYCLSDWFFVNFKRIPRPLVCPNF